MVPNPSNGDVEANNNRGSNERTPLVSHNLPGATGSIRRMFHLHTEGEPTTYQSFKALLLSSYVNVFLIAIPFIFMSYYLHWGNTAVFITSFVSVIPLAALLGAATEEVSLKAGQTLGALLNATFGNAIEAIVGIIALSKGELRIVQTSLLGSILSNLLLVLGCSFFAAGVCKPESTFRATAANNSASVMLLATAALMLPAAYHASKQAGDPILTSAPDAVGHGTVDHGMEGLLFLSRGTSIIMIFLYGAYLLFQMRTHQYLFEAAEAEEEEEAEVATMNLPSAIIALAVITVLTSFCADYLVDSIDEFANSFGITKAFIGLILIPIVGNAAEHLTSVWMAVKGKMEITIGVSVGSSIQIANGVVPFLVILGWILDQDLTLYFQNFETICLFISVLLVSLIVNDGKSNWLEGIMLLALYFIIAIAFWVS